VRALFYISHQIDLIDSQGVNCVYKLYFVDMSGDPKISRNETIQSSAEMSTDHKQDPRADEARVRAALHMRTNVDVGIQYDQMNQKIEDYLQENLPITEQRITELMDPACEVSIVIPAYGERDVIFRPIESLIHQKHVSPQSFEVIFVINNPGGVPQRKQNMSDADYERTVAQYHAALEENQTCLDIIRYINGAEITIDLSDTERKIIKKIQERGIKIFAIDKATPGNELPHGQANVGGARNRGVVEAVARFYEQKHSNGIIGQTDADTKLDEKYVFNLIKVFRDNPEVIGVAGSLEFEETEQSDLFQNISYYSELQYNYGKVLDLYLYDNSEKVETPQSKVVSFSGANMASRAYEAALVGGVPKIGGGEDPEFGKRLAKIGKIADAPEVKVITADRFSARTDVGAGHGQERIRLAGLLADGKGVEGDALECTLFLASLRKGLQEFIVNKIADVDSLKKLFFVNGESLLSDNELDLFAKKLVHIDSLESKAFLNDKDLIGIRVQIIERLKKIFPQESAETAAQKLINKIIEEDGFVAQKYFALRAEMIEKESVQIERNKKIIEKIASVIFEHLQGLLEKNSFVQIVEERGVEIGLTEFEVEKITKNSNVVDKFIIGMRGAATKDEAIAALLLLFKKETRRSSDDPLKLRMLELRAMRQAQKETVMS